MILTGARVSTWAPVPLFPTTHVRCAVPLWLLVGIVSFFATVGVITGWHVVRYFRPAARLARFLAALEVEWERSLYVHYSYFEKVQPSIHARMTHCTHWIEQQMYTSARTRLIGIQRLNEWAALARRESTDV